MAEHSACDGMSIIIKNSGVTYTNNEQASILVTGAGAKANGGSLKDASGNSPPAVPLTIPYNSSVTLYAASSEGSEGQAEGTVTIQCSYASSSTGTGTPEVIYCNYDGHPKTWSHQGYCTPSGTGGNSQHFTVTATNSGQQETGGSTWVEFQVSNGGTTGTSSSSTSAAAADPATSTSGTGGSGSST